MKKILISVLTLIFIISISIYSYAATTGSISLDLRNKNVKAGEEFTIVITASDTNNVNSIEYSGISIKDQNGASTTAITLKSIEAIGDSWTKMTEDSKTYYIYMGEATKTAQVFKAIFLVKEDAKAGTYDVNFEGLKVYSIDLNDDTTNIGTKTANVNILEEQEPEKDTTAPEGTISYDKTTLTNGNVTATITFNESNVTITNNDGKNTYVFTSNSEFTFEFKDAAGNTGRKKAVVTNIDKTAPKGTIAYKTNADGSVTATITFDETNVTITNNDGKETYLFTEKGEFTFEFKDAAGNTGTAVAKVESMEGENPPVDPDDTTPDEDDKELPQTGVELTIVLAIAVLAVVAIVSYKSYNRYKNI